MKTNILSGMVLVISVLFATVGCAPRCRGVVERNFFNSLDMEMIYVEMSNSPMGYYVCKYETRKDYFELIMGYDPSDYTTGASKPVELLRAEEAMEFCARLTEYEHKKGTLPAGYVYSLPTFDQWLCFFADAPREGAIVATSSSDGGPKSPGDFPQPVHIGETNRLGIVNLYGNIGEFCLDIVDIYPRSGKGGHITAGTSFNEHRKDFQRPTGRASFTYTSDRSAGIGFRCILIKSPKSIIDITGDTPLHSSAARGDVQKLKSLIAGDADLNARNRWGDTALHRAAIFGRLEAAKALISAGANVNTKRNFDYTPMHHAILGSHPEIALYLLRADADVRAVNVYGEACLYLAAGKGYLSLVRELLATGAEVDVKNKHGWTSLLRAVVNGHKKVVEILIKYGADVNVVPERDISTPLDRAKDEGHTDIVKLLKKHGAK